MSRLLCQGNKKLKLLKQHNLLRPMMNTLRPALTPPLSTSSSIKLSIKLFADQMCQERLNLLMFAAVMSDITKQGNLCDLIDGF